LNASTLSRLNIGRLATVLGALVALLVIIPASASADPTDGCNLTGSDGSVDHYTCYWKPPAVAGYEVKQDVSYGVPKPPGDGQITHMEVDLVDQNTNPVPIYRLMLHHIVFLNLAEQDKTCGNFAGFGQEQLTPGNGYAPERFYGAGEERAKITFPPGYGYRLRSTDSWSLVYMFMNHRKTLDDQAWVQYKVDVDTSGTLQRVRPYWFDANNCRADPIYNVPGAGRKAVRKARKHGRTLNYTRSADFTIQEDGFIVAGFGHVHGGARRLALSKPACNNLQVAQSTPTWGLSSHPFYKVRPILHEPGPIGMSAFKTPTGIPVRAGQTIRLNSIYDDVRPHVRVMGIFQTYIATQQAGDPEPQLCGGAPSDTTYGSGTNQPGRRGPVPFTIPLTGIGPGGVATDIKGPPGKFRHLKSGATVTVGDRFFSRPNIVLRQGAKLNYLFQSNELHNLTLANGPLGIGSPNYNLSRGYTQRFRRPGVYRFFCGLHPTQMTERVIVKKKRRHHRHRHQR
jgi:plastocyanin